MNFRYINLIYLTGLFLFVVSILLEYSYSWVANIIGLSVIIYSCDWVIRKGKSRKFFIYLMAFFIIWFAISTFYLFETLYFNAKVELPISFLLIIVGNIINLCPYLLMVLVLYCLRRLTIYGRMSALLTLWMFIELSTQNYNYSLSSLKLSYYYVDSPFNTYFPIGGSLLVSFLVLLVAVLLSTPNRYTLSLLFGLCSVTYFVADIDYFEKEESERLKISLIQTGEHLNSIKIRDVDFPNNILELLDKVPVDSDLVILPEVISNQIVYNFPKSFFLYLREWAGERKTDFIFGAFNNPDNGTGTAIVSAFYVRNEEMREYTDDMPLWSLSNNHYGKQALIPFAETTPRILKHFDNRFENSNLSKSYFKDTIWDVKGFLISPSICYDFYFPKIVNKNGISTNLLLNIGSQSWLENTQGPEVLHKFSRMRAMENANPVLRVDTHAISEFIDQSGSVVFQLPVGEPIVKTFELSNIQGNTPYANYADSPLVALLLLNLIWILVHYGMRRNNQLESAWERKSVV